LEELCRQSITSNLSIKNVCAGLCAAHSLEPALDDLVASLLIFLAENVEQLLAEQRSNFMELPLSLFVSLLKQPSLVSHPMHSRHVCQLI